MSDEAITPNPDRFIHTDDEEGDAWVTDAEVEALAHEREVMGTDHVQQAEEILKQHLPTAVNSIAKLARVANNETVRLNAAKYIIDRNLGKITEPHVEAEDPIKKALEGVIVG